MTRFLSVVFLVAVLLSNRITADELSDRQYIFLLSQWRALALDVIQNRATVNADPSPLIRSYEALRASTIQEIDRLGRVNVDGSETYMHFIHNKWLESVKPTGNSLDGYHYPKDWATPAYYEADYTKADDLSVSTPWLFGKGAADKRNAALRDSFARYQKLAGLEREFWAILSTVEIPDPRHLKIPIPKESWTLFLNSALKGEMSANLFEIRDLRVEARQQLKAYFENLRASKVSELGEEHVEVKILDNLLQKLSSVSPFEIRARFSEVQASGYFSGAEVPPIHKVDHWVDDLKVGINASAVRLTRLVPKNFETSAFLMTLLYKDLESGPSKTLNLSAVQDFEHRMIEAAGGDPSPEPWQIEATIDHTIEPTQTFPGIAKVKIRLSRGDTTLPELVVDYCHDCRPAQKNKFMALVHDGAFAAPVCRSIGQRLANKRF